LNKRSFGIILILIGILFLLANLNIIPGLNFLLLIGIVFLLIYFFKSKHLGFLIPGCIFLSIGLFALFKATGLISEDADSSFLLFLAGAFWAVFFIHTIRIDTTEWGARFWPVFPAGALSVIGLLQFGVTYWNLSISYLKYTNYVWPVALIIAGIIVLLKSR